MPWSRRRRTLRMRILFMGTPEFAVPSLRALCDAGHEICGVFTQPDRPKNRGMRLQAPPVKEFAVTHNIPVFQPDSVKDGSALEQIKALAPELIVVAAYGRILPEEILNYPASGCINVHSSLLPKYRGAAPIQWAILNGEPETGVTIMYMAKAMDAGDIIAQSTTPIDPDETAQQLHDRLAQMGAELLIQTVEQIAAGTAPRRAQGVSIDAVLQDNDAYHALQKTGGLIMTGPTGTNVNDVAVALIRPL